MRRACVVGGSGYIASALIRLLLEKGYAVNATVRDPDDVGKTSHLRDMRDRGGHLKIMQADLTRDGSFDEAVSGCDFVFLVAAPTDLNALDPEKELIEPAVQGTLNVLRSCKRAGSVRAVVLTSSGAAVSCVGPLEGTEHDLDEESWSDTDYMQTEKPPFWGYVVAKVLAEKEAFKFAQSNNIRVVSVIPTTTVGPAPAAKTTISMLLGHALLSGDEELINGLKVLQTVTGSISLVHVEDVSRAHLFLAENSSASGRYICNAVNTSVTELAAFLAKRYPQYNVKTDFGDFPKKAKVKLSNKKLVDAGFEFKYAHLEEMYDNVIEFAKARGILPQ